MKPTRTTKQRVTDQMKHARNSFAKHRITESSHGRWLVKQPGTSTFGFEVVVLAGGKLLIHGDINAVIFAHFHPNQHDSAEDNASACVHWMASRKRPDDHYFIEKAKIGSDSDDTVWTRDDDTLREETQDLIKQESEGEVDEDGAVDSKKRDRREALEHALNMIGSSTHEEVQREVYEALDCDGESVPQGKIVSTTMVYAHAALQRLDVLLKEVSDKQKLCRFCEERPWVGNPYDKSCGGPGCITF